MDQRLKKCFLVPVKTQKKNDNLYTEKLVKSGGLYTKYIIFYSSNSALIAYPWLPNNKRV